MSLLQTQVNFEAVVMPLPMLQMAPDRQKNYVFDLRVCLCVRAYVRMGESILQLACC